MRGGFGRQSRNYIFRMSRYGLISVVKVYIQIVPKIKYFGDNLKFYQPAEPSGQGSLISF
jgi:hypothetical protein